MTRFTYLLGGVALAATFAAPAAAQYQSSPYQQQQYQQSYPQYQQSYPQYQQQTYQQQYPQTYQNYGYQQPYGYNNGGSVVGDIIDQLLGNRYNVTDRQAVRQCATAAAAQASAQYGGGGSYGAYNNRGYGSYRVTSISGVERRSNGLRVSGTMGSTGGYGNQAYGYQGRGYAGTALSFRCNVDYRGAVTGVRVRPAGGY